MKKIKLLILLVNTLSVLQIQGQTKTDSITITPTVKAHSRKLYITIGGGYGLSTAPNSAYASVNSTRNLTGSTNEILNSTGSFGRGMQFNGTFGYMFTENIGAELNIGYLLGSKITNTSKSNGYIFYEASSSGNMLRLTPTVRISVGKNKIKTFMRFGLVIGMLSKIEYSSVANFTYSSTGQLSNEETEGYSSGGVSLGFSAGLGANYKLTDRLSVFAEIALISQAWAPKKSVTTKYISNGIDRLATMNISEKESEYVSSYDNASSSTSTPTKRLKNYTPFSSIGINIGIHLAFGK